jgi:ABC-type microcin C transport system permease subunit YejE
VLARILYGTRISILFGLLLTFFSSVLGVLAGAIQGYYGGKIDLWGQRFIEVRSGMPTLFLIILLSRRPAGLLVAAGHYGTVRLDGAGRRRAGGIPAHP